MGTLRGGPPHPGEKNNKHRVKGRAMGGKGKFKIDLKRELVWRFRVPREDVRPPLEPNAGLYDCVGPIDALVDLALGRDVANCSPIELGARTVEILDAAYRSARSGLLETVRYHPNQ